MRASIGRPFYARPGVCFRNTASSAFLKGTSPPASKDNWTMCGWFVQRVNLATFGNILSLDNETGLTEFHSLLYSSTTLLISNGSSTQGFASTPGLNEIYFGAYTVDGSGNITGYWRWASAKALISTTLTASAVGTPTAYAIGAYAYDPTVWANINAWNVKIWTRALSAQELMMESLRAEPVSARSLFAWYPLDGANNEYDLSGNSRHLTPTGAVVQERSPFPRSLVTPIPKSESPWKPVQYARPSSTLNNGNFLNEGSTQVNLHLSADEKSPNDVDFIHSTAWPFFINGIGNDQFEVGLSAVTDPTSSSGHILRWRYQLLAFAGSSVSITVQLMQGATLIVADTSQAFLSADTTVFTVTKTLTGPQADAITNYAGLSVLVSVVDDNNQDSSGDFYIYWIELEVPQTTPSLISVTDTNSFTAKTTGTVTTPIVVWKSGDLILAVGETENNSTSPAGSDCTLALPTATGLTFAQQAVSGGTIAGSVGDDSLVYAFSAVAGSDGSSIITCNPTSLTSTFAKGLIIYVYRNATLGAITLLDHSANKTISIPRAGLESAIVVGMVDWNAVNDIIVDPTPATTAAKVDLSLNTSGAATFFSEHWVDQGATGTTAYGITNHTGTVNMSGLGIEIKAGAGAPPTISSQPSNQRVIEGQTATFSITSPDATSYQWQKEDSVGAGTYTNIGGATSSSYTTPVTVGTDNFFRYRCNAINSGGTTTSSAAYLLVDANAHTPKGAWSPYLKPVGWG